MQLLGSFRLAKLQNPAKHELRSRVVPQDGFKIAQGRYACGTEPATGTDTCALKLKIVS